MARHLKDPKHPKDLIRELLVTHGLVQPTDWLYPWKAGQECFHVDTPQDEDICAEMLREQLGGDGGMELAGFARIFVKCSCKMIVRRDLLLHTNRVRTALGTVTSRFLSLIFCILKLLSHPIALILNLY